MTEPGADQWERIEEMMARGSIGWCPSEQPSADLKAVLDYVDELQSSRSDLDVLAGLTPDQVAAIPCLIAWLTRPTATADQMTRWIDEYEALKAIYQNREAENG